MHRFFRSFPHRLAGLALIVSLGIGVLFAHTVWSMRKEQAAYQLRTNANLSSTLAQGLEWLLEGVDSSVQKTALALGEARALEHAEASKIGQVLMDVVWRDIDRSGMLVLDAQGRLVHRSDGVHSLGRNFAEHDFFQAFRTMQHEGTFIGQPTQDLLMGEFVLPVARGVYDGQGALAGVVVGALRMREINAWLATMDMGARSGVNVIREDGLILTRFPYRMSEERQTLAGSRNLERFFSARTGSFVATAVLDGVRRLYTYNRVGRFPVVVNVAQSTESMLHSWTRNAWLLGAFALLLMAGCMGMAVLFHREVRRREHIEADLFAEKERMRLTLQSISDAVICSDAQGRITYLNTVAEEVTGLSLNEAQGQAVEVVQVQLAEGESTPLRRAVVQGCAVERQRITLKHHSTGECLEVEESASPVTAADGTVLGAVAVLRDVSVAAAREARMQQLAFHDVLTGLPNRILLQDRAMQLMAHSQRSGEMVAVVYLDLDGFKDINDKLGHQAGDVALVHVAKALQACVRQSDTVCRLGGDEFVLLLPGWSTQQHLQDIVEKIQQACAQPFVWEGRSYGLHASIGVALYPEHATQWDSLLHCADMAMYAAKQAGRNQAWLFEHGSFSRMNA